MSHVNFAPIADSVLARLSNIAIEQEPFPHLVLTDAFPSDYFGELVRSLPPPSFFSPAEYPGTGRFTARHGGALTARQTIDHSGLVLRDWTATALHAVEGFFRDDRFARVLLDRFSDASSRGGGPAIPVAKHSLFRGSSRAYTCVFALYKDLAGYEISPHLDNPAKIVTFLWYLQDDPASPSRTLLCKPRPGVDAEALGDDYEVARREDRAGLWLDWDRFDIVKAVGGPNVLLAFAPNDISYHGVRISSALHRRCERTVVRGFIAREDYADTRIIGAAETTRVSQ